MKTKFVTIPNHRQYSSLDQFGNKQPILPSSLWQVFLVKLISHCHETPFKKLIVELIEVLAGIFLALALISPIFAFGLFLMIFGAFDFAILKIGMCIFLVKYRRKVFRFPFVIRARVQKMNWDRDQNKTIDGIPIVELTDYLIRNKHFKREGINGARQTFGIAMEKYNKIASNLERCGALIRGENNSRILDPKWSRQALFDFLSGNAGRSENTKKDWIRIFSENIKSIKQRFTNEEIASRA